MCGNAGDAAEMIARLLDPTVPTTFVDVGANVGDVAVRFAERFPAGTVHALEPAPDVFAELEKRCAEHPRVRPVNLAAGDRNGAAELRLTENRLFSSVLAPSDLGVAYHGDRLRQNGSATVPMARLDDWAKSAGVARVDALKIDVQGLELDVLRGAERMLRDAVAVNCEAQVVPEYRGAATFSAIDTFLSGRGFVLHQIHDLWSQGHEQQLSCLDAIWIREEALGWLRRQPTDARRLWWGFRVRRALEDLAERGKRRVALYGAGYHTREVMQEIDDIERRSGASVVAVIDDNQQLHGQELRGRPIVSPAKAAAVRPDAVVLSSNSHEDALWEASAGLRSVGVEVVRLYGSRPKVAPARARPAPAPGAKVPTVDDWWALTRDTPEVRSKAQGVLKQYGYLEIVRFVRERGLKRVLEFGHGFSTRMLATLQGECEVHGVDDFQNLPYFPPREEWEKRYQEYLVKPCPKVRFHRGLMGTGSALRLEKGAFDLIASVSVLEEVNQQVARGIADHAFELLRPGGWLVTAFDFILNAPADGRAFMRSLLDAGYTLGGGGDEFPKFDPDRALIEDPTMVMNVYQGNDGEDRRYRGHWSTLLVIAQKPG